MLGRPVSPLGAVSRRGAVFGGAGLVLTGCDLDPRADPTPSPAPTSGAPADPSVEADLALLTEARSIVLSALATVTGLRGAIPVLRPVLGPLRRLHATHLGVLEKAGPSSSEDAADSLTVVGDASEALAGLRRDELRLQRRLADLAVAAASGAFARMLASMSAAVAAHLAALPEQP